jgi:cytochrome c556
MRFRSPSVRNVTNFLIVCAFTPCAFTLGILFISGCGGQHPVESNAETSLTDRSAGDDATLNAANAASASKESQQDGSNRGSGSLVRTDKEGRKWIGEIPYDVWFKDPLAVARDNRPLVLENRDNGNEKPSKTPKPQPKFPQSATRGNWKSVAPMEILQAEVKKIRNRLTRSMRTVGTYRGNYQDIRVQGATLSAVAAIVIKHPGSVSWKPHAAHVRDLGTRIEEAANGLGRKDFEATQVPYEQLIALLSGNQPAGLPFADRKVEFADCAERGSLMKRMQKAFDYLKQNVNTQAAFREDAENATHEATMLATLAEVIATNGYDSTDEKEYAEHAAELIEASLEMRTSFKGENFKGFIEALDRVNQKCSDCHAEYRFAEDP